MEVFWQNNHGVDLEGTGTLDLAEDLPQKIDVVDQQAIPLALGAIHGKKIGHPWNLYPAILCHWFFPQK